MSRHVRAAFVLCAIVALASCDRNRPPNGGDQERQLAAATSAHDAVAVERLLTAGADPNKMVKIGEFYHSSWEIALDQIRPGHPERVAIVKSMLKAHANLERAWGQKLVRGSTWTYSDAPIAIAMRYPVPEVIGALMNAGLDPRLAQNALIDAIETHESDVAHILVDAGVNVNCNPGALTPLVAAIEARDEAMMTYLEARGAREKP
jgi:hypothetical protein